MTEKQEAKAPVPAEQIVYAAILQYGSLAGIILLVIGFILYVTGILPPLVPVNDVVQLWHLDVHKFVEAAGTPTGWNWVASLGRGDYINYIGIALLAGLTVLGYAVLLPAYIKRKDTVYAALVFAEICVLLLAASGVLGTGGH